MTLFLLFRVPQNVQVAMRLVGLEVADFVGWQLGPTLVSAIATSARKQGCKQIILFHRTTLYR